VVTGTSGANPGEPYHIKIEFTPAAGDNLTVKSIGIWLPQGFNYTTGSGTLEKLSHSNECYPDSVDNTTVPGGQSVVWSYNSPYPHFAAFPDVDPEALTMTTDITFNYTPPADKPTQMPLAMPWITTDMDPFCPNPNNVPISWDTDSRFFKITSATGDTRIEAYSSKSDMRKLGDAIAGDYVAIGNSLMTGLNASHVRTHLESSSPFTVSSIPPAADVIYAYLYWSGFQYDQNVFSDTCSNFNNWDIVNQTRVPTADNETSGIWNTAPCWDDIDETTYNDNDYMTGTTDSGGYKLFNFSPFSIPAGSTIADLTIYIRARDSTSSSHPSNDIRPYIKVNGTTYSNVFSDTDPGTDFTTYSFAYTTNPNTSSAWTLADINGTGTHPLQEFGVYSSDLKPDIDISMVYAQVNYSLWTISSNQFQGRGSSNATTEQRTLTMNNNTTIDLSSYAPGTVAVYWEQTKGGTLESSDNLYFALSGNGGNTWSSNIEAFHGNNPASPKYYIVPDAYKGSNFKIRFYFNFNDSAEYVYLDDIKVFYLPPDTSITFQINGQQVYLDADGNPQAGSGNLTASSSAVMVNEVGVLPPNFGYSYACYRDVSKLVKKYPVVPGEPHHTGNAVYTVGAVSAQINEQVSYAGWSLIIIYGSPNTAGRYIYLRDIRDVFAFNPGNPPGPEVGTNLDFDQDGVPGGKVTGFTFPNPITDKNGHILDTIAAKLTCFVGEGDDHSYVTGGDYLRITGQQSEISEYLSNSASPPDDVWNGYSYPGTFSEGVDIDTFEVPWASNILTPGDTELTLDLYSPQDAYNLIYIIMSVRSETTTSGTTHYMISNN
jgi:hypothetical protein